VDIIYKNKFATSFFSDIFNFATIKSDTEFLKYELKWFMYT